MNKTDLKKVLKIYKGMNINDIEVEDFISKLRDKSDDLYEKDKDEKADEYSEVADTLESLVEAYQSLWNFLEEKEMLD